MIEIRTVVHDSPAYWKTVDLRRRVLRTPLGLDFARDELMAEGHNIHIAALDGEAVVGVVILSPPGKHGQAHLRQMAVAPEAQWQGIGARLVRELERIAAGRGWREVALAARESAVGFYARLGYVVEGET